MSEQDPSERKRVLALADKFFGYQPPGPGPEHPTPPPSGTGIVSPSAHPEKVGHCAACAAETKDHAERIARLEKLVEQLDDVLSKVVRETPAGRSEIEEILKAAHDAVPVASPVEETVPERRKA